MIYWWVVRTSLTLIKWSFSGIEERGVPGVCHNARVGVSSWSSLSAGSIGTCMYNQGGQFQFSRALHFAGSTRTSVGAARTSVGAACTSVGAARTSITSNTNESSSTRRVSHNARASASARASMSASARRISAAATGANMAEEKDPADELPPDQRAILDELGVCCFSMSLYEFTQSIFYFYWISSYFIFALKMFFRFECEVVNISYITWHLSFERLHHVQNCDVPPISHVLLRWNRSVGNAQVSLTQQTWKPGFSRCELFCCCICGRGCNSFVGLIELVSNTQKCSALCAPIDCFRKEYAWVDQIVIYRYSKSCIVVCFFFRIVRTSGWMWMETYVVHTRSSKKQFQSQFGVRLGHGACSAAGGDG